MSLSEYLDHLEAEEEKNRQESNDSGKKQGVDH